MKIWDLDPNKEEIPTEPVQTVSTMHGNNIFCAELCPNDMNILVSGAADGTVVLNYLNRSSSHQRYLHQSRGCVHKTIYDKANPMCIFIADDTGSISRVDIRTNAQSEVIFSRRNPSLSRERRMFGMDNDGLSTKAMVQFNCNLNHLLLGGEGFDILLMDLRIHSTMEKDIVQKWSPALPYGETGICAVSPYRHQNGRNGTLPGVSISGLRLSKDEQTILGSYHKDQIYLFDVADGCPSNVEAGMETSGGARQCLGGHLNEKTFLKDVAFFGPSDDYVVSGCDSGMMWVWDANSGYIESNSMPSSLSYSPMSSRPCRVIGIHEADDHICNGVIPHPYLPRLASYGIDSEIKLWANWKDEEIDDYDDEKDLDKDTSAIGSSTKKKKVNTKNRPRMELVIDNLVDIHLLRCCSPRDGFYNRRSSDSKDNQNEHNAVRVFQRCDFIRDDENFMGPKNWELVFAYYLNIKDDVQDDEAEDEDIYDSEEYSVYMKYFYKHVPKGVRRALINSWNNGKVYDIERFRCTLWDIRYTNATSRSLSFSLPSSCSSSSITSQIGEKRDRGLSPVPLTSVNSREYFDQDKLEPEKDLVQLVRMEVERSKAIEEQENLALKAAPAFPSDFATINCVSRPGFPEKFSSCLSTMTDQFSSSSSLESPWYSWEALVSRNVQKHHGPQIPCNWRRVKRFLDDEKLFINSFKERLLHRFPFNQCNKQIENVFNDLDENFDKIIPRLSDDISMMFYIYQIAAQAKEEGTLLFGEDKEAAVQEYYKADRYLQLLSRDLLDRLVIWEMSFCDQPQDSITRISLNPDGSSINNCDTDPKLVGLRRCFVSLLDVHRYFSPRAYCPVVRDQCNVDEYLPIAHEYFQLFLYKSIGVLLLHILYKKMVLLAITVKSNIAAYALKAKRFLLSVKHSTMGLMMSENFIVNESLLRCADEGAGSSSQQYIIQTPYGILQEENSSDLRF